MWYDTMGKNIINPTWEEREKKGRREEGRERREGRRGGRQRKKQQIRHQPAQLGDLTGLASGCLEMNTSPGKPKSLRNDGQGLYLMVAIVTYLCQAHRPICVIGPLYFIESTHTNIKLI